jgi:hypothetical protein
MSGLQSSAKNNQKGIIFFHIFGNILNPKNMKHFYLSSISVAFALTINAQSLTQANHAPTAGDSFATYQCDSTGISPGASGANAMWNFASIVTHSSVLSTYTTNANSNSAYPNADVAQFASINNTTYYKSTSSDLKYFGGNLFVSSVAATLNYSSAALRASYPMSLSTTSTSVTGGSINITSPLTVSGTFTGTSTVLLDGSGTLTLPGGSAGTYTNVLRVLSTQVMNYTTSIANGVVTQTQYDYFAVGIKAPLLTIASSTFVVTSVSTSTQVIVTINKNYLTAGTIGIKENIFSQIDLSVYPNPSNAFVNFNTASKNASSILLYDVVGKLLNTQKFVDGNLNLNTSEFKNGLYTYSVLDEGGQILKTVKLVVTH